MYRPTLHRTLCLSLALALAACQGGNPSQSPPTKAAAVPGAPVPAGMGTIKGTVKVDAAGGGILAAGGMNLRLLQAAANGGTVVARGDNDTKEAPIGPDGAFALVVQAGDYTLEATVPDGQGGVTKVVSPNVITVPLAQDPPIVDAASLVTRQTGSIQGLIEIQDAPEGETPEGVDVFLSGGTSVVGKAGETGRFALTNVAEGTWNVVVAKPGYKRQVVKGVVVRPGRPTLLDASVVLERDAAPQAGVTGAVQSSDGKAILGAIVSVYPKDRQAIAAADAGLDNFTAITDEQGRYAILNLPPADYTVQVYRPFYQLPPRRSVTVTAGAPQELGITKLTSTVVHFGKVSGAVLDEGGQPVDGAVAQLEPPVTDQQFADAAGKFTLDRILPGEYKLSIAAGGFVPVIIPVLVENKPNFRLTLSNAIRLKLASAKAEEPQVTAPAPPPPPQPQPAPGLAGEVTTLAGSQLGFADATGPAARFSQLVGVALGRDGALFVADRGNNRIRRVTAEGVVTTFVGARAGYADGQGTQALFQGPNDLALGPDGNLYVSEEGGHRIRRVTPDGVVTTVAGSTAGMADGQGPASKFNRPFGLDFGSDGNLYVADLGNHRLRKVTPGGVVSTLAGSGRAGYADGNGAAARFVAPYGVAAGRNGDLFLTDAWNHRIRRVTLAGDVTTVAGSGYGFADGQGAAAQFNHPSSVAVGPDGSLYVADELNHRIRKIAPDGKVTTVAGSAFGFADGRGVLARFSNPAGIELGPDGRLYVAEWAGAKIRVIR